MPAVNICNKTPSSKSQIPKCCNGSEKKKESTLNHSIFYHSTLQVLKVPAEFINIQTLDHILLFATNTLPEVLFRRKHIFKNSSTDFDHIVPAI